LTHTMQNRSQLLLGTGCVALAMGMLFSAERAEAQAINGTETFVQGSGTRILNATGSETILIDTPTAVIDWTPDEDGAGNALDFLPTGTDVTYENSDPGTDFAVLNRILPAANNNVVVIDGTVVSQFIDALGGATPGGTVAFYSPTGLFIGDNAVFDVGNLILTTLDIDIGSFDAFTQSGGTLSLAVDPVLGPQTITINPGASITASAENSYFVVTSAEIQMFGTTDVNGSQAFVAGDDVLLTLNNGLFDIQIPVGTSSANPININGDVGGPASTGVGDNHLIYAVAAAQNDSISLLFSGNLGFEAAASAGIVNGEIIISANYDVFGRTVTGGTVDGGIFQDFIDNSPQNPTQADVFITDFFSSSTILAAATNEVQVSAQSGSSFVDGDLIMVGRGFSELTASNGQTFDITGNVLVSANDFGVVDIDVPDPADLDAIGGISFIDAFGGGTLNITGNARVTARGGAGYDLLANIGGLEQGGFAQIGSTGGFLNIGGDAIVSAEASGFQFVDQILLAGDSIGGTANIFARDGGQVTIDGLATVSAQASGRDANTTGVVGSNAIGGNALLESTNGGTLDIMGSAQLDANAFAGSSNSTSQGALADGGDSRVLIDGTGSIILGGQLFANGFAFGGQNIGGDGGDAVGGSVGISVISGGTFAGADSVLGDASGTGGEGLTRGGNGQGGIADIVANGGALIDLAAQAELNANGFGGEGAPGGDGVGGFTTITASVGSIAIGGDALVLSTGMGGSASSTAFGASGGVGTGGRAQIAADGTPTEVGEIEIIGFVSINAGGLGGAGGIGDGSTIAAGAGGGGFGGSTRTANAIVPSLQNGAFFFLGDVNSTIDVTGVSSVTATGVGGAGGIGGIDQAGGDGGNGFGGSAIFGNGGLSIQDADDLNDGTSIATIGDLTLDNSGVGGNGGAGGSALDPNGNGGMGAAGVTELNVSLDQASALAAGVILNIGSLNALSNGFGGSGDVAGDGLGGVAAVSAVSNGELTIASVNAEATGIGGSGRIGGDGFGGGAADPGVVFGGTGIGFRNGSITITGDAGFTATGFGGASTGDDGGAGTGGFVTFQNAGLGGEVALQGELTIGGFAGLLAEGIGGDGGDDFAGGNGTGGLARIDIAVGGTVLLDSAQIAAGGLGGSGISADGGGGIGGTASVISRDVDSDLTITNGLDSMNNIAQTAQFGLLTANGEGGQATGGSGVGGDGLGGIVSIVATDQGSISLPLEPDAGGNRILARGFGGASSVDGGVGGGGSAGTGVFEADTGGQISSGATLFSVFALGGSSTQAFDDNPTINVDGGDAEGGERRITVRNGATLTSEFFGGTSGGSGGNGSGTGIGGSGTGGMGVYIFEDATFNAVGRNILGGGGGAGGQGGIGGDGAGGDNSVIISNSTINLISNGQSTNPAGLPDTPSIVIFNQNLAGLGQSQGGNAIGGSIDVAISNSSITGGTLSISNFALGGNADVAMGTGGEATAGSILFNVVNSTLDIQNGEDVQLFDFDPVTGMSIPGEILPGSANEIISRAQGGDGFNAGGAIAGDVNANFSGGSITINPSSTADGLLDIASSATVGDGVNELGIAVSGGANAAFVGTDITGDGLSVRSDATSEAIQQGAMLGVAVAGAASLSIVGDATTTLNELTVSATGNASMTGEASGGLANLFIGGFAGQPGPQVDVDTIRLAANGIGAAPGSSNNRHGQFVLGLVDAQLTTREINATASGDTLATGEIGPSLIDARSGTIEVTEQLTVDAFADVQVNTGGGGRIGDVDQGNPNALISITSQNTIQFTGDDDEAIGVGGSVLNLSSSDIIIEDGARIGAPEVILNSLNLEDPAVLGGAGTPGGFVNGEGYTLVGEELDRIEVERFTFSQQALPIDPNSSVLSPGTQASQLVGPNDPSLIIRDYVGSGSAGDGTSNITLNVNGSGGILRIEGVAGLEDATAADSITLSAQERIEIVTPGGVGIVDIDGNPIGALLLQSDNIWAADALTIELLQNDPNFAGRNDLLASAAAGSDDPLGYIRGGEVSIFFSETLLVRNTGTNEEQGGILVGDGGLLISNELGMDGDVFAFGARFDVSTGGLITGEEFFNEVDFFSGGSGSSSFSDESAFNDCLINTGECLVRELEPEPQSEGPTEEEEIVIQEAAQANNAGTVEAAVQTAAKVIASEEESNEDFGADFPSFVEAEESEDDGDIDDPVASGGDASFYGRNIDGNVEVGGSSDD